MKAKFEKEWLQNELKSKPIYHICKETGTSFSVINRLIKIYGIERKPMLKDVLTSEVLYSLFVEQRLTDAQISKSYFCSIETVKKLRAKYNITYESRTDRLPVPSLEYFKKLYIEYGEYGFSRAQMMKLLGYSVVQFMGNRKSHISILCFYTVDNNIKVHIGVHFSLRGIIISKRINVVLTEWLKHLEIWEK